MAHWVHFMVHSAHSEVMDYYNPSSCIMHTFTEHTSIFQGCLQSAIITVKPLISVYTLLVRYAGFFIIITFFNCILIKSSLDFVPKGHTNNMSALVQIMGHHPSGEKPSIWTNDGIVAAVTLFPTSKWKQIYNTIALMITAMFTCTLSVATRQSRGLSSWLPMMDQFTDIYITRPWWFWTRISVILI